MSLRILRLKRFTARVALGGVPLVALLGTESCVTNAARANFLTAAGNGAIGAVAASASTGNDTTDAVFVQPAAGFLQDLWNTWIGLRIPLDPAYQNDLLVP